MRSYIISFNVRAPEKQEALKVALKSYKAYCPITNNSWAIQTDKTAVQIRDHLLGFIGANDRLFVIRSGTEAAWRNSFGSKNNDWLKKYL